MQQHGRHESFLDRIDASATLADVSVVRGGTTVGPAGRRATAYDLDVPKALFDAMFERAARHAGYSAVQTDYRQLRVGDLFLTVLVPQKGQQQAPAAHTPLQRVYRKTLVDCEVLYDGGGSSSSSSNSNSKGPKLLFRSYRRVQLPYSSFPCDIVPDSIRRVRCLSLRVNPRTSLLFEVVQEEDEDDSEPTGPRGADGSAPRGADGSAPRGADGSAPRGGGALPFRRVRVEMDVQRGAVEDDDVRRTVQNTIQVVLLGMKPISKRKEGLMKPLQTLN